MSKSSPLTRLLQGRASAGSDLSVHLSDRDGTSLHDKMRQAYWWIVNNAIICPYYDIEYGSRAALKTSSGDEISLNDSMSYSSFVLIPLLTLFTCRRALMIGGPGRGKTASAILMALIAGMSKDEVRRGIQRGHPQLTITDLIGSPLPADMMKAEDASSIKISWRKWIGARVKIIDEYNRIPTKTQSALLSLMAEGYAEMLDQYVNAGQSSWFLTANDDAGGGTFQVIEALKDRIDVVVRAVPFNSGFTDALLTRLEKDRNPEDLVPADVIFSPDELAAASRAILEVGIPSDALDILGYFLGQLDFCRMASPRFEFMSKDTLRLSGSSVSKVCDERCPLDKRVHLCSQTENGVSVRTYQTSLHFAKALAYFRGNSRVEFEDFRQIVPWVLHEKLVPNSRSLYFEDEAHAALLLDRVAWIRKMMDAAVLAWPKHQPIRAQVDKLHDEIEKGLAGVDLKTVNARLGATASLMRRLAEKQELSGPVYEEVIRLKSIYSRYQNYAEWLKQKGAT